MCRITAYCGAPLRLSTLLLDAPHSLKHQSRSARQMGPTSVAGDGWGIGWYPPSSGKVPGMLKSILPLWSDENAETSAHAISSGSIVGHIRWASPGVEVCFLNTPLYVLGEHLVTINGELKPWPGPLARDLRAQLDGEDEAAVHGSTDAEMLSALWRTCFRRAKSADAGAALQTAVRQARDLAREHDGSIRVSMIVADRNSFTAIRYGEPDLPPSLYYLAGEDRWHGGSFVASEPLDEGPGWKGVPPSTLVRGDRQGVQLEELTFSD